MTVSFLSVTKGLDDYISRNKTSFDEVMLNERRVFRFRKETDNKILWYPEDNRNQTLKSLGWYPEKTFTSVSVQQSKVVILPSGRKSTDDTDTINVESSVILYFLEKYPPGK